MRHGKRDKWEIKLCADGCTRSKCIEISKWTALDWVWAIKSQLYINPTVRIATLKLEIRTKCKIKWKRKRNQLNKSEEYGVDRETRNKNSGVLITS